MSSRARSRNSGSKRSPSGYPAHRQSGRGQNGRGGQPRVDGRRRPASNGLGGDHLEGRHAVRELLIAGQRKAKEVILVEGMDRSDAIEDIETLAQDKGVPIRYLAKKAFGSVALTESHQGVVAKAEPLKDYCLDDLLQLERPFLLVLDGITDPGNMGALLRTAECAGVTGVVLPRHRAVGITPTVTKTAAGAIEYLRLARVGGIPATMQKLDEAGVLTIGLEATSAASIQDAPIESDTPVALVLGAEGSGLSRLVRQRARILAGIPMAGHLNSLNVATAGGVACFEVIRRRAV